MTYRTTQEKKDWLERTGSHSTRPVLRVSGNPTIDPTLMEAKRKRREWLSKINHPLREKRVRKELKRRFYRERAKENEPDAIEARTRLAMVMQQLGIDHG
jgi:hypothetical protein